MSLTKEDLLAISQVLDVKLDSKLNPIESKAHRIGNYLVERVEPRLSSMEGSISRLNTDLQDFRANVEIRLQGIETRLQDVETRLQDVETRLQDVETNLQSVEGRLTARIEALENRTRRIEVDLLENNVIPRLNTIEVCYTDTYNRYKDYVDRMEAYFADTELLKTVVSQHSERIQKLA